MLCLLIQIGTSGGALCFLPIENQSPFSEYLKTLTTCIEQGPLQIWFRRNQRYFLSTLDDMEMGFVCRFGQALTVWVVRNSSKSGG